MADPITGAAPTTRSGAALATFIFVLAALLALAGCGGRESSGDEELPPPNPLIYEIANANGEVEGWLLGTIHALPDGANWRTEPINQAIAKADYAILEVAALDDSAAISALFARLATTPGVDPLPERVAPDLRETLATMMRRSNQTPEAFAASEDWAAAILLAQVDAPGRPSNGVDRAILREFKSRGVQGFETAEEQLRIFDRLAPEDQRVLLEETVREWAEARAEPGRLMRAYVAGDEAALEARTETGIMTDPELREALLVGRNQSWMAELEQYLRAEPRPLVAVGAAHIVGPDGLPAMLKARGYSVRRLR